MLTPRSISLSISFTALDWSRPARPRDPWARPIGTPVPVAGPGTTVVANPAELRGLGVIADGPGTVGVTPGLKIGGGGVCGTGIARIPGFTPAVPPFPLALAALPAWENESDSASPAASSPTIILLRMSRSFLSRPYRAAGFPATVAQVDRAPVDIAVVCGRGGPVARPISVSAWRIGWAVSVPGLRAVGICRAVFGLCGNQSTRPGHGQEDARRDQITKAHPRPPIRGGSGNLVVNRSCGEWFFKPGNLPVAPMHPGGPGTRSGPRRSDDLVHVND